MERKQEMRKFVSFIIASVMAIGALLWYKGYCYGIAKARSETQIVESEEQPDNQTIQEENDGQTDGEKGETTNRTIQDVINSQTNHEEYMYVGSFHEGLAYASKKSERSVLGIFGYIDEDGNEAIEFRYLIANRFREGLAVVSEDAKKFGYIDHQGNWAIEPILDSASDFDGGEATVRVGINRYVIDQEGNILEEIKSN